MFTLGIGFINWYWEIEMPAEWFINSIIHMSYNNVINLLSGTYFRNEWHFGVGFSFSNRFKKQMGWDEGMEFHSCKR